MNFFVWVMMGIAIWHFAVFVPDRFWGGIVGAFGAAAVGAVVVGLAPGRRRDREHQPRDGAPGDARARCSASAASLVLGRRATSAAQQQRLTPDPSEPAPSLGG